MGSLDNLKAHMEPDIFGSNTENCAIASIAISLKRIADWLDDGHLDKTVQDSVFHALESSKAQR